IGLGVALGVVVWRYLGRRERETEHSANRLLWTLVTVTVVTIAGWFITTSLAAGNQAFLAPESSGITSIADLEAAARAELGLDDLSDLDAAVESGAVTQEQVDAATVVFC